MHNRIYQIWTAPVEEADRLSEDDFFGHWFAREVAEYICDDNDRGEDIRELRETLTSQKAARFSVDKNGGAVSFVLLPDGKEAYFAGAYEAFTAARERTLKMGLREFASGDSFEEAVRQMDNAFCQGLDCYVAFGCSEGWETIPLDEFIRRAEIGPRYYIGGVIGYHN